MHSNKKSLFAKQQMLLYNRPHCLVNDILFECIVAEKRKCVNMKLTTFFLKINAELDISR